MIALILLLLACSSSSAPADRGHYLRSLHAPAPEARQACLDIAHPALQGECLALRAAELAMAGEVEPAGSLCDASPPGFWQDECRVMVTDGSLVEGPELVEACDAAGSLRSLCLSRGLARARKVALQAHGRPGEEDLLELALSEAHAAVYPDAEPLAAEQWARDQVGRTLARRVIPSRPFSLDVCLEASEGACAATYVHALGEVKVRVVDELCEEGTPTSAAVEAAGLQGWEPEAQAVAERAWTRQCRWTQVSTRGGGRSKARRGSSRRPGRPPRGTGR